MSELAIASDLFIAVDRMVVDARQQDAYHFVCKLDIGTKFTQGHRPDPKDCRSLQLSHDLLRRSSCFSFYSLLRSCSELLLVFVHSCSPGGPRIYAVQAVMLPHWISQILVVGPAPRVSLRSKHWLLPLFSSFTLPIFLLY